MVWPPVPGYFRLALVRRGWLVPAKITHDGTVWQATINGRERAPHADPALAPDVDYIWHRGEMIPAWVYEDLLAQRADVLARHLAHPAADPYKPINRMMVAPLRPMKVLP